MADEKIEEIPHQMIIDELQQQLNARTAELVVANARIRAGDEKLSKLENDVVVVQRKLTEARDEVESLKLLPDPARGM